MAGHNQSSQGEKYSDQHQVAQVTVLDSRAFTNMLKVRVGSRHLLALLDSGANISVISREMFQLFQPKVECIQSPDFKEVSGVGGERHQVLSKVSLNLCVDNLSLYQNFHVITGRHDMILGLDFLCKYDVKVDFGEGTVSIGNTTVKLSQPGIVTCLARSRSCVTLPRQRGIQLPVTCQVFQTVPEQAHGIWANKRV